MPISLRLFSPDEEPDRPRKQRKRLPQFLRWPEAMRLLDWCVDEVARRRGKRRGESAKRDEQIVRIGLYLGLRCAEIQDLEVPDIDLPNRSCIVRNGKGGKDGCVCIPTKLIPYLEAVIAGRKEGLLIAKDGDRMAGRTIRWRIARAAKAAGLAVHVHPHTLRSSYAVRLLETGSDIRTISEMLRHSSPAVTMVYLKVDPSRFADDVDRI